MSSDFIRRLWRFYTDLKIWAGSSDATSKRFTVIDDSYENPTLISELQSNNMAGASSIQNQYIIIIGLIYPSTECFKNRALKIEVRVPSTYPQDPPEVYMKTKIRHPNIEKNGKICTTLLDKTKKWESNSLADVVKIVTDLMDKPEKNYVVDAEMGSIYDTDISQYNKQMEDMVAKDGISQT